MILIPGFERSQERSLFFDGLEGAVLCHTPVRDCIMMESARSLTPNLDDVSMNLRSIFSISQRLVWATNDFRSVMTRFLVPGTEPLSIK